MFLALQSLVDESVAQLVLTPDKVLEVLVVAFVASTLMHLVIKKRAKDYDMLEWFWSCVAPIFLGLLWVYGLYIFLYVLGTIDATIW